MIESGAMQIRNLDRQSRSELRQIFQMQMDAYKIEAKILGVESLPPLDETFEEFEKLTDEGFVCLVDAALVGAVFLEKSTASILISRLAVDPHFFRRGIARHLIEHCLAEYPNLEFRAGTGAENYPALNLYRSFGFEVCEEIVVKGDLKFSKLHRPSEKTGPDRSAL
jgi:ribosomal protein S18 acetylase RimI-like enzyme